MEYRVGELEKSLEKVCEKLDKIMDNHLPHINMKIAVLMTQMVIVLAALTYLIFGQ